MAQKISAQLVKELRTRTGAGMMDCKKALIECDADMDKAIEYLQVKGITKAAKRAGREAKEGFIGSYIHHDGKTGVMVEVNCETDFVARNEDFRQFAKHVAMHIAAAKPLVVSADELPEEEVAKQKDIFAKQAEETGKPANIAIKIAEGRMAKWKKEITLLDQPFVMDTEKTIEQYRAEFSGTIGENIKISRFARFIIGG